MPLVIDPTFVPPAPPAEATSPDGLVTATLDSAWAGVMLRADFSAVLHNGLPPVKIQFLRGDIPVRSGDPGRSPGGVAYAYEHEAPLGVASSWYALPIYDDGFIGPSSEGVALILPNPAGGPNDPGCWLKSIEVPGDSVQLMINSWPQHELAVFSEVNHIPGRPLSVGSFDTLGGITTELTLVTSTLEEETRLLSVISAGTMLIQARREFRKPEMYALVTRAGRKDFVRMSNPVKLWTLQVEQVERPDTYEQPLRIPGRSFQDRLEMYPTFGDIPPTVTFEDSVYG